MIREVTNACAIVASREERDGLIRARMASTNILGGKKNYTLFKNLVTKS